MSLKHLDRASPVSPSQPHLEAFPVDVLPASELALFFEVLFGISGYLASGTVVAVSLDCMVVFEMRCVPLGVRLLCRRPIRVDGIRRVVRLRSFGPVSPVAQSLLF
jgi:hypothetical protein